MPRPGRIAFMSQSGALCTSILDIALAQNVGFSRFVSLGNKADLDEIDFLEAWSGDPESAVIMAYLEAIADGHRFIDVARHLTKKKPVIAIKSGTTSAGAKAVSSHTGSLAGSDRAYEAAFKQAGVIRAGSIDDLFDFATAMARQPLPRNDRVAVVTNAGGPGIMASDALERAGLRLAQLGEETMGRLREILPSAASVSNPVDLLGDARANRYRDCLELVGQGSGVGALIVILTPQFMTQVEETAEAIGEAAEKLDKPVLACFMGEAHTRNGVRRLTERNVPNYLSPERAVTALRRMFDQHQWQEEALPDMEKMPGDRNRVRALLERVLSSVSVAELSEGLAGQVLCCPKGMEELVEHVLVGAMSADTALVYFRRKPNKAVVTGGDRTDIQLAALETSTRCLILTGNIRPTPQVMMRAEDQDVPVILTRHDTMTTVGLMEPYFGASRFHQSRKIQRLEGLLEEHMDFEGIYRALKLSPKA
jgi:acetyltransferase